MEICFITLNPLMVSLLLRLAHTLGTGSLLMEVCEVDVH